MTVSDPLQSIPWLLEIDEPSNTRGVISTNRCLTATRLMGRESRPNLWAFGVCAAWLVYRRRRCTSSCCAACLRTRLIPHPAHAGLGLDSLRLQPPPPLPLVGILFFCVGAERLWVRWVEMIFSGACPVIVAPLEHVCFSYFDDVFCHFLLSQETVKVAAAATGAVASATRRWAREETSTPSSRG